MSNWFSIDNKAIINPADKAYLISRRRILRTQKRSLYFSRLMLNSQFISTELGLLRLRLLIAVLKTPDYLTTILLVIFRGHRLFNPPNSVDLDS